MYDLKKVREILIKNEVIRIHFCFDSTKGRPAVGRRYSLQDSYTHRLSLTNPSSKILRIILDILKEEAVENSTQAGGDCRMLIFMETINEKDYVEILFSEDSDYIEFGGLYYHYNGSGLKKWLNGFCKNILIHHTMSHLDKIKNPLAQSALRIQDVGRGDTARVYFARKSFMSSLSMLSLVMRTTPVSIFFSTFSPFFAAISALTDS